MAEKFRSYDVARFWFTILEKVGWAILIAGVLVALIGGFSNYDPNHDPRSWESGGTNVLGIILSLICGGFLLLFGLFFVASAQYYRASVDSAEYSQQILATARLNLEISQQKQMENNSPTSFADLADKAGNETKASFAGSQSGTASPGVNLAGMTMRRYKDIPIHRGKDRFVVAEREFPKLEDAKAYVDDVILAHDKTKA